MIEIAERLRPFSHAPGTSFLIPFTQHQVKIFPARLLFSDLETEKETAIDLPFLGPIQEFTAELDLEQGHLRVFGKTERGYMRYKIVAEDDRLLLRFEKLPEGELQIGGEKVREKGEYEVFSFTPTISPALSKERLFLGVSKAQEWQKIKERLQFQELFPLWLRLAQFFPKQKSASHQGMFSLLKACEEVITSRKRLELSAAFKRLFLAAFEGVFVPQLIDKEYQGIVTEYAKGPLLPLLTQSAEAIRSLFVQEKEGVLSLLPCLFPEFHCGKMKGIQTEAGVELDLEWTKGKLRRVYLRPTKTGKLSLLLPKTIRFCRMKKSGQAPAQVGVNSCHLLEISVTARQNIWLDRFEV